jgi:hypothetical protein
LTRNAILKLLKPLTIAFYLIIFLLPACDQNDEAGAELSIPLTPVTDVVIGDPSITNNPGNNNLVNVSNENLFPLMATEAQAPKPKKKKKEVLVIGKNLKTGMSLESALTTLGIPRSIKINRGTEPQMDSISVEYLNHGLRIHALTRNNKIEELEVLPGFKGKFVEGAKIGSKFPELIKSFGIPDSKDSSIAKYPQKGIYIFLKKDSMISAKLFAENSKLLDHKLLIN